MKAANRRRQPPDAQKALLLKLSEASLRITQDLDLDTVLQGVIDGARMLTGARYGALLTIDSSGGMQDLITSGLTPEEQTSIASVPKGLGLLGYLTEIQEPLRLKDIAGHPRSVGFPEGHPPMKTFLGTPIRHGGRHLGNIYLTEKEAGQEFTLEDEEILVMFASQAALVINNAQAHGDERRARAEFEALIDSSPLGVMVFDGKTGDLLSVNEEARRILGAWKYTTARWTWCSTS